MKDRGSFSTGGRGRRKGTWTLAAPAKERVVNTGNKPGTRLVDGEAPSVTITKIYPKGGAAGGSTVAYPAAVSGRGYTTGYDGSHYLFGDTVHVKATVTDGDNSITGSGVKANSFLVGLDGLSGGSAAPGT